MPCTKIKYLIILICIVAGLKSVAQKVPYEKLDSLSNQISKLQLGANNLVYFVGQTEYKLSFPEKNFQVRFYNQLATLAAYKLSDNEELLHLYENIDLARVSDITFNDVYGEVFTVELYFKDEITIDRKTVDSKGVVNTTYTYPSISIFCRNGEDNRKLVSALFKLCSALKKAQGLLTQQQIDAQLADWENIPYQEYYTKHPNSLFAKQANLNAARY
jgi:hypothetical protein